VAHRLLIACILAAPLAFAFAFGADRAPEPAEAQGKKRPNVVVVMTDDQDIRSMAPMREMRRLIARQGVKFTQHVVTMPHCCTSRATFLTGQYAHNHGVLGGRLPNGSWLRLDESTALPVALRQRGYRTGFVGKYLNGYPKLVDIPGPIPPGWDYWVAVVDWALYNWRANVQGGLRRFRGGQQYQTDVLNRRSRRFIRESATAGQPFFLTVWTQAPHLEPRQKPRLRNPRPARRHQNAFSDRELNIDPSFDAPDVSDKPSFVQNQPRLSWGQQRRVKIRNRSRLASLLAVDELVRDVFVALERQGVLDDTYVIFTSDEGFMNGQHRLTGKKWLYEPAIRVPFFIRGPGIPERMTRPELTANIDIVPTIAELTGMNPLVEPDGVSLLDVIRRPEGYERNRDILLETPEIPRGHSTGIRTPHHVYMEHRPARPEWESEQEALGDEPPEAELYDLSTDPHQLHNLAWLANPENPEADHALVALKTRLKLRLEELLDCAGTSGPNSCR
jgi:N-acetylglucosamine-6-sulfatase